MISGSKSSIVSISIVQEPAVLNAQVSTTLMLGRRILFLAVTSLSWRGQWRGRRAGRGGPARRCVPQSPATPPARARPVPGARAECRARAGPRAGGAFAVPEPPCPPSPAPAPGPDRRAGARWQFQHASAIIPLWRYFTLSLTPD